MSDVLLFVARDIPSARRLLQSWASECSDLPPSHRPAVSVLVEKIGDVDEPVDLTRVVFDDQPSCCFSSIKVYRAGPSTGKIPNDVFSEVRCVRKRRQAERTLWDWHTLFRVSRGILQQLASAPEPAQRTNLAVSYVSAFDMSRLPQPLKKVSPWLKDVWGEWIQQVVSVDDLRRTRLPIVANALSMDTVVSYDAFCEEKVFGELYHDALSAALIHQQFIPVTDAIAIVTSMVKAMLGELRLATPKGRREMRVRFLSQHRAGLAVTKSSRLCLVCFVQPAEVFLPCECALCEICYRGYGNGELAGTVIMFDRCVLCSTVFASGCAVRLKPPTAGCRVLALDGGGVKGIVQLRVLHEIQNLTGLPIQIFFDLAIGTSVGRLPLFHTRKRSTFRTDVSLGGINALSIGVLGSSLDTCEKDFVELARKIFPKASTRLGRWCQKLSQCVRLVCKDGIYSPSEPILRSITGEARLRGPRKSLYDRKPFEQMKVAVTSIESRTSTSKLFTTYTDHNAPTNLVRVVAGITSAAPVYFPPISLGSPKVAYYDGLEIPLLHARDEALRLSPRKVPDYILSVGNGIMRTTPNTLMNSLSRFAHFSLESLWGHRQYEKLGGSVGEAFNEFRIDPVLDMEAVALDDADAIGKLVQQLNRQFVVNSELRQRIKQLSLVMVASLFYFSFKRCRG
ncbi:Putative patatin-like phospholipase domain, Acyl transferase/acyl hydrolase/lysophospholipase [Colletotrichum destructivum]|uniref:Patatin-like phospholipase domain, Acyl transferase/acyl hydrolase/lysophospholipase n=1 Tax=Colletotrichum destructivum TaxID=34406 RepID=A0AAX4J4R5_9PEZI|nr:Putative patatin-like phospholipase domain, Acyl transferase/acyl hydrolase/lysophospholipase [Colletotrichum destructivum]